MAQLMAAKATDTVLIIYYGLSVFHRDGLRWAAFGTHPAAFAFVRIHPGHRVDISVDAF